MWRKIKEIIKRVELAILKVALVIGRGIASGFRKFWYYLGPWWHKYSKTILITILILYVIGAVAFGWRLYRQKRFDKIDRIASYIYPFPVAKAGRSIMFSRQLERKISWARNFATKTQNEVPADLSARIIDDMVSDSLVMQEAGRLNVKITADEVDETFNLVIQGIGSEEEAIKYVKSYYGMTLNQLKAQALPKIALEKIKESKFVKVKARIILIKDDKKADEVLKKAQEGGDFAALAKDNSEDQGSKENGGLIAGEDYIYRESGLPPQIEEAMFKLNPGEISGLIKTDFGNVIIKVDEKAGQIDQSPTQWLEGLRKKYPVKALL